jgi:hypothetical protein
VPGGERRACDVEQAGIDRPERGVQAEPLFRERRVLPRLERGEHRGREGLVDLVEVEVLQREAVALQQPRHRVHGRGKQPIAPMYEIDGRGLGVDDVREHRQPVLCGPLVGAEQYG